jgi:mRNA-degrading endonuclease RelE of RelBE toxin-antitoxin system
MDKIQKALNKLSKKEKAIVKDILSILKTDKWSKSLNIKKLRGYTNIFRVRKNKIRIVYELSHGDEISILLIDRKNDNTYNL